MIQLQKLRKKICPCPLSETMAISCIRRAMASKVTGNPSFTMIMKYSLPRRLAEAVLEAINIHIESPKVVSDGFSVLNVAMVSTCQIDVPVIRRLVSIGVVNTIVSILNAHPDDAEITQVSFGALSHILRVPESYNDLNIPDMCEMVVKAFRLHAMRGPESRSVAGMGLGLANSICTISMEATECLISHGMVPLVLSAIKAHPTNSCVKDHGCSAISSLAHGDRGVAQLASEGAVTLTLLHP